MSRCHLLWAYLAVSACASPALGQDIPQVSDVSLGDPALDRALDRIYARLQPLFRKYYPAVAAANLHRNGIRFEQDVATFELPAVAGPGRKAEKTIQRGPKRGGILCHVWLEKGTYRGQLAMADAPGDANTPTAIDRGAYKSLYVAPYSAQQDAHLWVVLNFPPQTSADFLQEFIAVVRDFNEDGVTSNAPTGQNESEKRADVLEGTLRVHPKFHYRYYIDGFGDGQKCALIQADDRLSQIKPGTLVRARGALHSNSFGQRDCSQPSALISTWIIYMDVADVEVVHE